MTGPADRLDTARSKEHEAEGFAGLTAGAALSLATGRLAAAGVPDAPADARLLLQDALGADRTALFLLRDRPLDGAVAARFAAVVERRAAREPVSRIRGEREFWSLPFRLGPAVLDPRPDSETLVEAALERLVPADKAWRILDLGTGSGCLLLAILSERPWAFGVGVDRSAEAVFAARGNARSLGLDRQAGFLVGDWGTAVGGRFDLVLSNPPYIADGAIDGLEPEVASHDPRRALAGGADGLDAYRRIAAAIDGLMEEDGVAIFELGISQGDAVAGLLGEAGLATLERRADIGGVPRCLVARKALAAS